MRNTHIYSGVLISIASLWCLIWFIPENTVPAQSELDLSPALVPSISVGAMLVTAVIMLVHALRENTDDSGGSALDDEFGSEAVGINLHVLGNAALWAVVATVSWFIMRVGVAGNPAKFIIVQSCVCVGNYPNQQTRCCNH